MKQLNWYQIFGQTHTIPDGRTVTPTDDIQIWLNCADIWDKTYTTLAEVLADTTTLLALINSPNAVDYMVRSTTWAVPITVPLMTSNTTPSGICSESASYGGYLPYLAFDRDTSTKWVYGGSGTTAWIQYQFPNAITLAKMTFKGNIDTPYLVPSQIVVKGSNDGNTFTDLKTITGISADSSEHEISINANTPYAYYRLECTARSYGGAYYAQFSEIQFYSVTICDSATAMSYIGLNNYCANTLLADSTWCNAICNSEYFESVLNVKAPVMTSDTTPSGVASASSVYNTSYKAFQAFNGTISPYWTSTTSAAVNSTWLRYQFPSAVKIYKAVSYIQDDRTTQYKVQSSNDNLTWSDRKTMSVIQSTEQSAVFDTVESATSYQFLYTGQSTTNRSFNMLYANFYGREDV